MEILKKYIKKFYSEYDLDYNEKEIYIEESRQYVLQVEDLEGYRYDLFMSISETGAGKSIFEMYCVVFAIPVKENALPFYRKLLEHNVKFVLAHFSLSEEKVFLISNRYVNLSLLSNDFDYSEFKDMITSVVDILNETVPVLRKEFFA